MYILCIKLPKQKITGILVHPFELQGAGLVDKTISRQRVCAITYISIMYVYI